MSHTSYLILKNWFIVKKHQWEVLGRNNCKIVIKTLQISCLVFCSIVPFNYQIAPCMAWAKVGKQSHRHNFHIFISSSIWEYVYHEMKYVRKIYLLMTWFDNNNTGHKIHWSTTCQYPKGVKILNYRKIILP